MIYFCFILGALMYLNEATLLNNIRTRYFKDRIYVSARKLFIFLIQYLLPRCILINFTPKIADEDS